MSHHLQCKRLRVLVVREPPQLQLCRSLLGPAH